MAKRKIIYAEFTLGYGDMVSAVHYVPADGMWYLRKKDIFNRMLRYNPKEGILEVRVENDQWGIYEVNIYGVCAWDNYGNSVTIY